MHFRFLTFLCIVCLSNQLYANIKGLPKITVEDLSVQPCQIDSSAHAYIISDNGSTHFGQTDEGIEYVFQKTTRIKILDKLGYEKATQIIQLYRGESDKEYVDNFEASSYTVEDGKIVVTTINEDDLFDEDMKDKWMLKKFTIPNVKSGSIIEFTYMIYSPFLFTIPEWNFQSDIPTLQSAYKIKMCPYYEYVTLRNGFLKYDTDTFYRKNDDFIFMAFIMT